MKKDFKDFVPAEVFLGVGYQAHKYWNSISDIISKQIFVSCMNTPKTRSEIAEEICMAPVYLEEKIKYLSDNKFLKITEDGKYLTDFIIYPNESMSDFNYELADHFDGIKKRVTDKLYGVKNQILAVDFYGKDFDFEYLLWILYVYASSALSSLMIEKNKSRWAGKVPESNGKDYRIFGRVHYPGEPQKNRGVYKGVSWSNLHNNFTLANRKAEYANLYEHDPFPLSRDSWINEKNVSLLMKIFDNPDYKPEENEKEFAANFISQNILKNKDGRLYLNMPVMTYAQRKEIEKRIGAELDDIAEEYVAKAAEICDRILLPLTREDMLEEYANWVMGANAFGIVSYLFYENEYLQKPEDYSASAAGLCLYVY
jgi:hypothetical protein